MSSKWNLISTVNMVVYNMYTALYVFQAVGYVNVPCPALALRPSEEKLPSGGQSPGHWRMHPRPVKTW